MLLLWHANAFVWSRHDYCNLLLGIPTALDLCKLQCVQNSLARIVTNTTKYSHITQCRLSIGGLLYIIPYSRLPYWCTSSYIVVVQNILHLFFNPDKVSITHTKAKLMVCSLRSPIFLLVYKFLHSGCPKYFAPFLQPRQSVYNTHKSQADGVFLEVPHFSTSIYMSSKHFGLSFACDAPETWNNLPDVHLVTLLHSFRRKLITYLFAQAYPPYLLLSLVSLCGADPCCVSGL